MCVKVPSTVPKFHFCVNCGRYPREGRGSELFHWPINAIHTEAKTVGQQMRLPVVVVVVVIKRI